MKNLDKIKEKFKDKLENIHIHNQRRIYIDLKDKKDIKEVAKFLFYDLSMRFNIASGVDTRSFIEILYHFSSDDTGEIISIRVKIDKSNPEIESIALVFKAAEWIEREIYELLGIQFKGHPDLRRLLLSDDWPKDKFPLRHEDKK
ncbi:MAG: NADH-quinone oxidoreductase subunit C [Candidatus Saelkia tenebricola]|nr:NADH-quinone oxidoreductase subunit C [Candidatus Saelkia tenebricola]